MAAAKSRQSKEKALMAAAVAEESENQSAAANVADTAEEEAFGPMPIAGKDC